MSSTDRPSNRLTVFIKNLVDKLTWEHVEPPAPTPRLETSVVQVLPDNNPQPGVSIGREKLSHTALNGLSLRGRRFDDLNGNQTKFVSCDFSYSIFNRAYFHSASFENCKFTGCRFYDSNLRGATFYGSDFRYATFHRTLLEPLELLASLPLEANLRRECLQNLRANAVEIGDFKSQRTFVLAEIQATADHLSRAIRGSDGYYRQKYGTFSHRFSAALQLFGLKLSSLVWGNGERPSRIIFSAIGIVLLLSLINFWAVIPRVGWSATDSGLGILRYSVDVLLDAQANSNLRGFVAIDYMLILMRYVYIGLFISVLYKTISHR